MWTNPKETLDLVTFTEEILNGKLHCLFCVKYSSTENVFGTMRLQTFFAFFYGLNAKLECFYDFFAINFVILEIHGQPL